MKQGFSRSQKLLSRSEFHAIYNQGKRHIGSKIIAHYRVKYANQPKLGITISRKWGKATLRNRFKRVVREAYRLLYSELPRNLELNIHPRSPYKTLSSKEVKEELRRLLKKIRG